MKIVSMVPSWTETLIECGAEVVGRTRFCIHPESKVASIQVVGGTKDLDFERLQKLGAELLLLDKEENPSAMATATGVRYHATHITQIADVSVALDEVAEILGASTQVGEALLKLAGRWRAVEMHPALALENWREMNGVVEWLREADSEPASSDFVYVIWMDPWMAAGRETFIASVLEKLGLPQTGLFSGGAQTKKYPSFEWAELRPGTVAFFSSEPYPFAKKKAAVDHLAGPACIVDGESFSWFGIRSLKFLETSLGI